MAGFTQIPNEALEQLARRKFNGTQMSILLAVIRFTYGFNREYHDISLTFLERHTGIKKKRLSSSVNELIADQVLKVHGDHSANQESRKLGLNTDYHQWTVESWAVPQNGDSPPKGEPSSNSGMDQSPNTGTVTVPQKGDQEIKDLNKTRNKDDADVIGTDRIEIIRMAKEVEEHFLSKRPRGFSVSPTDFGEIQRMVMDGIPLDLIKESIDHCFSEYRPRHPKDEIRTIGYCIPRCYQEWTKLQTAVGSTTDGTRSISIGQRTAPKKNKLQIANELAMREIKEAEERERKSAAQIIPDYSELV